jgi:hypothetical protein
MLSIGLRAACNEDFVFTRSVYFETMRGIIERLFGWDHTLEEKNFAQFFKLDEVRIITAAGQDVGWIQGDYAWGGENQSRAPLLREARIPNYPRGPAQVLHES